jgi:hypothetical protein
MKKPWGRSGHPWLSIPISGLDLWVAFFKIKIKEVEVRHFLVTLPLRDYKTYSRSVVKENLRDLVIPQLREMESADPPGMSSKILSSGSFKIFIGKGNDRYHKLFLVLFRGFCGLRDKLRLPL